MVQNCLKFDKRSAAQEILSSLKRNVITV